MLWFDTRKKSLQQLRSLALENIGATHNHDGASALGWGKDHLFGVVTTNLRSHECRSCRLGVRHGEASRRIAKREGMENFQRAIEDSHHGWSRTAGRLLSG